MKEKEKKENGRWKRWNKSLANKKLISFIFVDYHLWNKQEEISRLAQEKEKELELRCLQVLLYKGPKRFGKNLGGRIWTKT